MRRIRSISSWYLMALATIAIFGQAPEKGRAAPEVDLATASRDRQDGAERISTEREPRTPSSRSAAGSGNTASSNAANRWRYRYYNGRWWYYHPNNQWSYWNGNAWTRYHRQTYAQRTDTGTRTSTDGNNDSYGIRSPDYIQMEKNESRRTFESLHRRPPDTIQREKNEARTGSFEPMDIRPPGTIQHEKNDARAR